MDLLKRLEKATPQPGERVEQYELLSELGRGGCGVVFRALNHRLGDDVALKVMVPQMAPAHVVGELFKRFEREAHILRTLRHPHVVRITDIGRTDQGFPYFVMELIDGPTLEDMLLESALSERRVARIAMQVLEALQAAHEQGIVHRDLKPGNIMLRSDLGLEDYAVVLDFGIAKLMDGDATLLTTSVSGTPWYMAPEQAKLDDLDGRVDVYALGVIMAECLTGQRVVTTSKPFSAAVMHASDEPLPFDDVVKASALYPIIARATDKDRTARYQSADDMRAALAAIVDELGIDLPAAALPAGSANGDEADPTPTERDVAEVASEKPSEAAGSPATGPADEARPSSAPAEASSSRSPRWAVPVVAVVLVAVGAFILFDRLPEAPPDEAEGASGPVTPADGTGQATDGAPDVVEATVVDDAMACGQGEAAACLRVAVARRPESANDNGWEGVHRPLRQACAAGSAEGCLELGHVHRDGLGLEADIAEALRLYEQACETDPVYGCTSLGLLFRDGRQVARDIPRAGRLFDRACEAGNPMGCNELGLLYEQGLEGVQDDERAKSLFERACMAGLAAGCTNLAVAIDDPGRAYELFATACDADHALGCYRLGVALEQGQGVEPNASRATDFFARACELGQSLGCQRLERNRDL